MTTVLHRLLTKTYLKQSHARSAKGRAIVPGLFGNWVAGISASAFPRVVVGAPPRPSEAGPHVLAGDNDCQITMEPTNGNKRNVGVSVPSTAGIHGRQKTSGVLRAELS